VIFSAPENLSSDVRSLQFSVLDRASHNGPRLSTGVREAFLGVPRHFFVDRYRDHSGEWADVTKRNLPGHLHRLYLDAPLIIWDERAGFGPHARGAVSTVSQPTFVLHILEALDIKRGESVFELGTGSGWNAALMAWLAMPGTVYTFEIIKPLADQARRRLRRLGIENVRVITGDGTDLPPGMRFHKAVFTAGAQDLPDAFHTAIRPGGKMAFVYQSHVGADLLMILKKTEDGFLSEQLIECGFVPVTGNPAWDAYSPQHLESLLNRFGFSLGEGRRPEAPDLMLLSRLERAQEFLSLHDGFIPLHRHDGDFAWSSRDGASFLVARPWEWLLFGGDKALQEVSHALAIWEAWGRPHRRDLRVRLVPRLADAGSDGIVTTRPDTKFIWTPA
jgi:protein-L-isoaspartate(D-aspartate) O-methyltransferase